MSEEMKEEIIPYAEEKVLRLSALEPEVLTIISALRLYRVAVKALLDGRYRDGFADGVATSMLESRAQEAEDLLHEPE